MNKLKKNALKCIKLSLAAFMLFTSVDMKVFAEDTEVVNENKADEVEVLEETDVQNTTETVVEEVQPEEVVEEQIEEEPQVDLSVLDNTDFTSGRLLVSEEALPEEAPVIGVLDGMALVQYETEESAKIAYLELSESADVVVDTNDFGVAEDTEVEEAPVEVETPVETVLTEESNPFTEADGIVSVLGDDGIDYHGHGQNMINTIKGINPSAKVLSIKALDNSGVGGTSAIYAAIRIAIDNQVKIINLSISATKTEDNKIIEDIINEAVEKGIKVVGAAGNNNIDAVNTIPGGVESAIVIGASDDEGNKQPNSNFGGTVDYLMPAKSTSYAAAKVSAYLSLNIDLNLAAEHETVKGLAEEVDDISEYFTVAGAGAAGGPIPVPQGDGRSYYTGAFYRWYDSKAYYNNNANQFTYAELTSGGDSKLEAQVRRWVNWASDEMADTNPALQGFSSIYASDTGQANSPYVAFKEEFRQALLNALNRMGPERTTAKARIVAIGYTYAVDHTAGWWVVNPPIWDPDRPGGAKMYTASDVVLDKASYDEIPKNYTYEGKDGLTIAWDEEVDRTRYNQARAGETWRDYVYRISIKDWGNDTYNEWYDGTVWVIAVTDSEPNSISPINLKLQKTSTNPTLTNNNSCYSLSGAKYGVYTDANATKPLKDKSGNTIVLTTNANGVATKNEIQVTENYKTLYVKETTAPKGYKLNTTIYKANIVNNTHTFTFNTKDEPLNDPLEIRIRKKSEGNQTIIPPTEGTEFTLYYYDNENGNNSGDAIKTWVFTSKPLNNNGVSLIDLSDETYKTSGDDLYLQGDLPIYPLGTYVLKETKSAPAYLINGEYKDRTNNNLGNTEDEFVFIVKQDGENTKITLADGITELNGLLYANNELIREDEAIRGDLMFSKVNEDGKMRPNTPFLIALLDNEDKIIEAHVIVTDSSGIASTAFIYDTVEEDNMIETTQRERKHSENTNKMDNYVKKNADGSYSVTEEGEALLASGEASTYGVWFSQGTEPDDDKGALFYGTYQIFEIQCKENRDLGEDLLISDKFQIKNKIQEFDSDGNLISEEGKNVKENQLRYSKTFVDLEVLLDTKAKDVITDTQTTFGDKEVVLSDTISFSNIKSTSTYKWEIDFVETETGNVLSTVVVDKFKPEATNNAVNTTNQPKMAFTVKTDGTITPAANIDGTVNKGYQGTPEVTTTGNVDTTGLGGKSISVVVELYEYITGYDFDSEEDYKEFEAINFITSHNTDRKDENEKIYIPKIETVAQDKFTKDHVGTKDKKDSIKDTVKLTNISPKEKYQLVAYVWDLDEDKLFSDKKVVKDFYSDRANVSHIEDLTVEMPEFELDSSNFADKTLVVFEELWRVDDSGKPVDEYPVAVHTDKLDEDQSIHYIDIDTELTDEFTGDHVGTVAEKVTLTDKVDLKNLLKGMEYTIKGNLVYRADGTTKDGKTVKAGDPVPVLEGSETEVKFTPEESGNHTVYITYVVDSRNLEGIDVVSTEEAYHNDVLIDRHYDLEDDDQTVNFPKVGTVAVDNKTNDNVGTVLEDGTIIDIVEVCNLVPGEDYTITGKLVLQEDGSELVDVVSEPYSFTATEEQEGCSFVEITFKNVDATKIVGKSVVAFEYLTHTSKKTNEPVEVAKHEDIEDDAQTVHFPDVRTEATDRRTGDKVGSIFGKLTNAVRKFFGQDVLDEDETEIVDKVILTNLALDKTYTVKGKLMDQETGELLNGQEITAEDEVYVGKDGTLKAKNGSKVVVTNYDEKNHQVDGYIELVFKLGTDEITNKSVVVFEKLFHKNSKTGEDIEVNKHEDPNDEAQFVNLIEVDSVAVDSNTLTHMGDTPKSDLADTKIIETFNMRKLVNGQDYKVDFALVVREESAKQGKPIYLAEDGSFTDDRTKAMTKVVEFTALAEKEAFSAGATLEVEFDIKHETVAGYTLVVVADTYHNDTIVAIHNDIYNELESVHYPNIGTKAEITDTEKDVKARRVRVLDTVSYTNLTPGVEYTLVARGMDPETGKAIVKANGDEYVFTKTFTPTKPNGKEAVEMLFDRDDIESYKLVAFEKLFINYGLDGELEVARHEDLEDEDQTVVLYQKVKLTVNKKSKDTKMPLKGAEITVFDSKNEVVLDKDNKEAIQLTNEKGQVEFEIYMYVNEQYYARETKAPEGYALNTDKFNIAIVDKRVEEVEINIEILDELLIIVPPTGSGKLLIGAGVALLATIIALGYVLVKKKNTDTHKH